MNPSKHMVLCDKLNYRFNEPAYLQQALTHRSASSENNERYEFLGDAILSLVISQALFTKFPEQTEGCLSRLRAYLVKADTLTQLAQLLDIGPALYLGAGELNSGGSERASILADALEAIFAAVFLDGGFAASQKVILHLYKKHLDHETLTYNVKDAKTQLQEYLQKNKHQLPVYTLHAVDGDEHTQDFQVRCSVSEYSALGRGTTRKKAEQNAAANVLRGLLSNT